MAAAAELGNPGLEGGGSGSFRARWAGSGEIKPVALEAQGRAGRGRI